MFYLIDRTITNTYVYKDLGLYFRVDEVLRFDFDKNKYKLVNMNIEEIAQIKGGEQNG